MVGTVFVLGAGASKEAELPIGSELTSRIASLLDIRFDDFGHRRSGDALIAEACRHHMSTCDPPRRDVNPYLHAARRIRDGMPLAMSIDNFLEANKGDDLIELCGKLAIVRAILAAERASSLYSDTSHPGDLLNPNGLTDTWYVSFWQILTENCTVTQLETRLKSVKFIIFNYDRCIQRFLLHSIQHYYSVDGIAAARILGNATFLHPYGSVGMLPAMSASGSGVEYGSEVGAARLVEQAAQIKTFTEGTDPNSSAFGEIRSAIKDAQRIVFLGFAFHRQNLDLLWPTTPPVLSSSARLFGTTLGISRSDVELISSELERFSSLVTRPQLENVKCQHLFHAFRRSLSMLRIAPSTST